MRKLPKPQTGRTAVSIETVRRKLDAANTPREVRDVAQLAQLAGKWAKGQGYALDQQNAWAKLRIDALTKLGQVLEPLLNRHRPKKGRDIFRLKDAGISRDLSSLAQTVAGVSETVRLRYFAEAEREKREFTVRDFLEKVGAVKKSQHFTDRSEATRLYELTLKVITEYGVMFDCWLEPSAGDGSFFDLLPADRRLGIDIDSHRADIVQADFLTFDGFATGVTYAAIGNFPWGENGAVKCQSARKWDPGSASNRDPDRRLSSGRPRSPWRGPARVAQCPHERRSGARGEALWTPGVDPRARELRFGS